jgi:hypothetical protein
VVVSLNLRPQALRAVGTAELLPSHMAAASAAGFVNGGAEMQRGEDGTEGGEKASLEDVAVLRRLSLGA